MATILLEAEDLSLSCPHYLRVLCFVLERFVGSQYRNQKRDSLAHVLDVIFPTLLV